MPRSSSRLFTLLGVTPEADDVTLRRAFRQLTSEADPRKNPDDPFAPVRLRRLREAYDVLKDPQRRAEYAEFGDLALEPGFDAAEARRAIEREKRHALQRAKAALANPVAAPVTEPSPDGSTPEGKTWRVELAIGVALAKRGGRWLFKVRRPVACPRCHGSGRKDKECRVCEGTKTVRTKTLQACAPCHGVGLTPEWRKCRRCKGSGTRGRRDCAHCGGAGQRVHRSDCVYCKGHGIEVVRGEKPCSRCRVTGLEACAKCDGDGKVGKAVSLKLNIPRRASGECQYRYPNAGFTTNGETHSDLLVRFVLVPRTPRQ